MIAFILKHWRWLGSFIAMAAFLGWITWQDHRITTLKRELQAAETSAASYRESLAALQADTKIKVEALEAEHNREISRSKNMERLLGRIEGENNEKDAPVAPVLRDAIDSLYDADAASKAH